MRWAPYLLVGLFAGVLADRVRRRPLLVGTDAGRAVVLAAVAACALTRTSSSTGCVARPADDHDRRVLNPRGVLLGAAARFRSTSAAGV